MMTEAEYRSLLVAAPQVSEQFALALMLGYETGHRIGSIRLLRWADINFGERSVRWRPESDKIGLDHTTPLSDVAASLLERARRQRATIGDGWVFPAPTDGEAPCHRRTLLKWWTQGEKLAKIEHVPGLGYHSLRRRFANDLKTTNLRDLCGLGGWKSPQTVLTVYQQPELAVMREALKGRAKRSIAGGA
ncbi:MAG: tyrosine-type recombinase/integrase [Gemmatimonadaceae bacterium]|nr:tyrosine-type recombinase/integrase [Gemmatimonadaceae bacterium]